MEANELRIGNFVNLTAEGHENEPDLFQWALEDYDFYEDSMQFVEPIPISKDWLLKLGFKGLDHFTIADSMTIDLGRNRQLSIGCVGNPNEMIFIQEINASNAKKIDDLVCIWNYDYDGFLHVHQLQNLYFALTGKELTITEI